MIKTAKAKKEREHTIAIYGRLVTSLAFVKCSSSSSKWKPATDASQNRAIPTVDARILWDKEKASLTKI